MALSYLSMHVILEEERLATTNSIGVSPNNLCVMTSCFAGPVGVVVELANICFVEISDLLKGKIHIECVLI